MELVKVFDGNFIHIGEDTRENVHQEGKWHETFHCWFMDEKFVYIQKRSALKSDFPSLFDITAAGHLEATETVEDGIREVEEELGIKVPFQKLKPVGIVRDIIELQDFLDYEFAHVFLYVSEFNPNDFILQKEEVDSIHIVDKREFIRLCKREIDKVSCRDIIAKTVSEIGLNDFVPHHYDYFKAIADMLK